MSVPSNSDWYAYVKYKSGGFKEIVPISDIKVWAEDGKRKKKFDPQSLNDFLPKKFYLVTTMHGSDDGRPRKWYALIGKLGESMQSLDEEIKEGKRINWPVIDADDSEPNSTQTEEATDNALNCNVLDTRDVTIKKKRMKKHAAEGAHESLLKKKALHSMVEEERVQTDEDTKSAYEAALLQVASLKKAFEASKAREAELIQAMQSNQNSDVKEELRSLRKLIEENHQTGQNRMDQIEQKLEEYISKHKRNVPQHVLDWIKAI